MVKAIIGKKLGMTQLFDEKGKVIPVTVVEAGPCPVVMKKTTENDGYEAVQIGFGSISNKAVNKPRKGHFDKAEVAPKRVLREFRLENCDSFNIGDILNAENFEVGDKVDVSGISKGKGFAGTVKRYGNHMLKSTHGVGPVRRHAGSMGASSNPSRIMKGKRMPGHMGVEKITIQNLSIVKIDAENNLIAIKGAIPGPKGAVITICDSVKK